MLTIVYFAKVRDELNCESENLEWSDHFSTVASVKDVLVQRGEPWQSTLNTSILCSVNLQITSQEHAIKDGDEIAFFPPVTGG